MEWIILICQILLTLWFLALKGLIALYCILKKKSCKALNEIVTCQECVIVQFKRVRIRKAAGLDVICGYTLHSCADEQTNRVFTRL